MEKLQATKKNLPEGTVLRCELDAQPRIVKWNGDDCVLLRNGQRVNHRSKGEWFGTTLYEVVSRPKNQPAKSPSAGAWLASLSNSERKQAAMFRGLLAYFPDALAMVARHSVRSNEKHNPGQSVHWSREKSTDHDDCIIRHSAAIAADPLAQDDGQYEVVCRAWRALAALQVWIEEQHVKGVKL